MNIAELLSEDRLTLRQLATAIGVANLRSVQRYRDGQRTPDRERMRRLVIVSEGRVTPNDIYGLTELIEQLQQRRAQRLARKKGHADDQAELPLENAA